MSGDRYHFKTKAPFEMQVLEFCEINLARRVTNESYHEDYRSYTNLVNNTTY